MENKLKFQVGKISSKAKAGSYSACFEVTPQDPEEASRGTLLAVVAVEASEKFDAEEASKKVLEALRDNFYSHKTGGILMALERAVVAAHQRLLTIVFSGGDEAAVDFDLVAGVMWGNVLYLAELGNGKAVIKRGERVRRIGQRKDVTGDLSASDHPDVKTASGILVDGDELVLGTPKFFEVVRGEDLEKILAKGDVREVVEELKKKVEEISLAAGVVLVVRGEGSEVEELGVGISGEEESLAVGATELVKEAEAEHLEEPLAGRWKGFAGSKGKLDAYLLRAKKRLGLVGEKLNKSAGRLREQAGKKEYWKLVNAQAKVAWDRLGRPRTAVERIDQARNRRTLIVLAGALLLILVIGVLANNMFKGSGRDRGRFDNLVATAQGQYDEAQRAQVSDKSHAEDLLTSASSNLKEAAGMHFDDKKVGGLQDKVSMLQDSLNGITRVNPVILVDLGSLKSNVSGAALIGNGSTLYALDSGGALFDVDVAGKKGTVLSLDASLRRGSSLAQIGNDLLSLVPGAGIYSFDLKSRKNSLVSGISGDWGRVIAMASYQSYVYFLDQGKDMVWRYTLSNGQLKSQLTWLKSGSDLSGTNSIAVDGSVWLGEKGSVSKFVQGKTSPFAISGVSPQLGQVKVLFVGSNVYVVDSGRVVVIGKNGQFVAQYKSDKFNSASGLVVDEGAGKAYILAVSKIYEFGLN